MGASIQGWIRVALVAGVAAWPCGSRAQDRVPEPKSNSLYSALAESTPTLSARTRVEYSDQNFKIPGVVDLDPGAAYTARARVGFRTGEYKGFQVRVEYEVTEGFGDKRFNAAGVEGDMLKSGIGDPESARFGEAYLRYANSWLDLRAGRQRITLGNGIWVGETDFRNSGNTFDALTATVRPLENLELFYSYVYNVQRLFGSRGDENDFDSSSSLAQITWSLNELLKVRAYGFLLDVERQHVDALSTNTYGVIVSGNYGFASTPIGGLLFDYSLEGATQTDAADSPLNYRARFVKGELGVASAIGVRLAVGRQVFGSDNGAGFANTIDPQLVRDVFLGTPANGLTDNFGSIGARLPLGISAEVQYHTYRSKSGTDDYGQEIQVVAQKPIGQRFSLIGRVDSYRNADPGPATNMFPIFPVDTLRYSLQVDFKFN